MKEADKRQELVDKIIKKMEEAVEYERPWFDCETFPYNPVTGTQYRGINILSLMSADFPDPRFYTFNNIRELAKESGLPLRLKKGSEGIPVFKAIQVPINSKEAELEGPTATDASDPKMIWIQKTAGYVFNASQIDGLPPLVQERETAHNPIEAAEKVVEAMKATGLKVEHHQEGRAFYRPSEDAVRIPEPERFKSTDLYYRTLMHEIGHATGHASRLDREQTGAFGSKKYAFEELVAELTSYFMGNEIGLPYDPQTHENHAAYLKNWITCLKDDKSFLFKAAAQANRATDYQMERVNELTQQQHKENAMYSTITKQEFTYDDLNQTSPDPFPENNTLLHLAAAAGSLSEIERFIKMDSSMNIQNDHGDTALHLALQNGHLKAARLLIENGARVDVRNEKEQRPFAVADLTALDSAGNGVLHYAAALGEQTDVLNLIQRGADLDYENEKGFTALDWAKLSHNDDTIHALSEMQYRKDLEADVAMMENADLSM